jgi:hypothetical protein
MRSGKTRDRLYNLAAPTLRLVLVTFLIFAEPFIELASRQLPIHIGVVLSFVRGKFRIAVQNVSNICLLCCSNFVDYDRERLGRRSDC